MSVKPENEQFPQIATMFREAVTGDGATEGERQAVYVLTEAARAIAPLHGPRVFVAPAEKSSTGGATFGLFLLVLGQVRSLALVTPAGAGFDVASVNAMSYADGTLALAGEVAKILKAERYWISLAWAETK